MSPAQPFPISMRSNTTKTALATRLASANRSADAARKEASKLREELEELRREHVTAVMEHKIVKAKVNSVSEFLDVEVPKGAALIKALRYELEEKEEENRALREEKQLLEVRLGQDRKEDEQERLSGVICHVQSKPWKVLDKITENISQLYYSLPRSLGKSPAESKGEEDRLRTELEQLQEEDRQISPGLDQTSEEMEKTIKCDRTLDTRAQAFFKWKETIDGQSEEEPEPKRYWVFPCPSREPGSLRENF